jgi:hypothetical protein
MTDKLTHPQKARPKDSREQQLARALRENLKRRKAQAQARGSQASSALPSPPKRP